MIGGSTALDGVKVVEFCHFIAGPRCTQILADHGAEVIKVEPLGGDPSRASPPIHDGWSMYFASHNRGKRSLSIDLKAPESAEVLERLLRWADVLVTNYTPGASDRLGLSYESARAVNPRLVVVRLSAYGLTGSHRELSGFDGTVQARSGLAHMIGPDDRPPTVTSIPIVDFFAAVEGAYAALLGLRNRDRTGAGGDLDVSMADSAATLLGYLYSEVLVRGAEPKRTGSRAPYALTGAYATADGYVYVAPIGPAWARFTAVIGHPEWGEPGSPYAQAQARLGDRALIESAIEAWSGALTTAEVLATLEREGIPCGPVNSVREAAESELVASRDMLEQVALGSSGLSVPMPGVEVKFPSARHQDDELAVVPALGADSRAVLAELGVDRERLECWIDAGIVRVPGQASPA